MAYNPNFRGNKAIVGGVDISSTGGSTVIGDTGPYSNFTPGSNTVHAALVAIDTALGTPTGANTALSNLAATSINQDLRPSTNNSKSLGSATLNWANVYGYNFLNGVESAALSLNTANSVTAATNSGSVTVKSGDKTAGTGTSASVIVNSGTNTVANNTAITGALTLASGLNTSANALGRSGTVSLVSGTTVGGASGSATLASGSSTNGSTGVVSISSGNSTSNSTGAITLLTGSTSDVSGGITLQTGTGTLTRGKIKFVDGTEGTTGNVWTSTDAFGNGNWAPLSGAFANSALSNLTTTSINTDLLSSSDLSRNIGSLSNRWFALYVSLINSGDTTLTAQSGDSTTGVSSDVFLKSGMTTGGGTDSGTVNVNSGNAVSNSGDVVVATGTAGGTRGKIRLKDGSEGTSGWVWTSTDTTGGGAWMASGGSGANTALSNLITTAINTDLIFAHDTGDSTRIVQTADSATATATDMLIIKSGDKTGASAFSGNVILRSGDSSGGTGSVSVNSGAPSVGFNSGQVGIFTGATDGVASGIVAIYTGNTVTAGTSGEISLATGDAAAGASGDLSLSAGSATTTRGKIKFDANTVQFDGPGKVFYKEKYIDSYWVTEEPAILVDSSVPNPNGNLFIGSTDLATAGTTDSVWIMSGYNTDTGSSGLMGFASGYVTAGSGSSGVIEIFSGNTTDGSSGNVALTTGDSTGSSTGNMSFLTGTPGPSSTSGNFDFNTGATNAAASGHFVVNTGGITGNANSGNISLNTGPSDTSTSGSVSMTTGGGNSGNSGNAFITTGDSAGSGLSGTIFLTTGEIDSGTSGSINLTSGPAITRGNVNLDALKIIQNGMQVWTPSATQTLAATFTIAVTKTYTKISSSGDVTSHATTAIAAGLTEGQQLVLDNRGSFNITLKNAAGTELPQGIDYTIGPKGTISFVWTGANWRCTAASSN